MAAATDLQRRFTKKSTKTARSHIAGTTTGKTGGKHGSRQAISKQAGYKQAISTRVSAQGSRPPGYPWVNQSKVISDTMVLTSKQRLRKKTAQEVQPSRKARVSTPPTGSGCGAQGVCETSRYDVAQAWGQRLIPLAFGPGRRRRPWRSLLRDGDLITCSVTIVLLASLPKVLVSVTLIWCINLFL